MIPGISELISVSSTAGITEPSVTTYCPFAGCNAAPIDHCRRTLLYAFRATALRALLVTEAVRNPQTGKELKIAATTVPRFTPGAGFKAAVSGKKAAKKK